MNAIPIKGFYIISKGDPTVGISDARWKLEEDYYFDDREEFEEFRKGIKNLFEIYTGVTVDVITYEEQEALEKDGQRAFYSQYPVRYLIKSRDYGTGMYMKSGHGGVYGSHVGEGIHFELPKWMSQYDIEREVIPSTTPEYKEILINAMGDYENEIYHLEEKLRIARKNLNIIKDDLNYGK